MNPLALHIYAPTAFSSRVRILLCSTCGTRRRFWARYYEDHPAIFTCLTCGDIWSEGERMPRPRCRGWRERNVAEAKRRMKEWKERKP